MKFRIAIVLAFFSCTMQLAAQEKKAPEYLTQQALPDSVKNTLLISLDGKQTTLVKVLDKYKGKKVLVDLWASWCKDCIVSIPKYNKLRERVKNKNMVYLYLSIDENEEKWKKAIAKFDIKAIHFRIPQGWKNPFTNYINLDWIPRYLVLDEKSNIILPKAVSPDDKAVYEALMGK